MVPQWLPILLLLTGTPAAALDAGARGSELQIDGVSAATVDFDLQSDEYLHVQIRAIGTDITLELLAPDGSTSWESDDRPTAEGLEELWFVASTAGVHRLQIGSRWGDPGTARLESIDRRQPSTEDRLRTRAEVQFRAAERDRRSGNDLEGVIVRFRDSRQILTSLGLPARVAAIAAREAIALQKLDRTDEAVDLLKTTIDDARQRGDATTEAATLNGLAIRTGGRGDLQGAVTYLENAIDPAFRGDDDMVETRVHLNLALYLSFVGQNRRAAAHYRRAGELAGSIGFLDGEASAWFNASLAHRGLRDYGAYFEDLRRADPLLARLGQAVDQGKLRINEGVAYVDLGEYERAADRFRGALEVLPTDELVERVRAELNLGQVALLLGDLPTARTRVERCLAAIQDLHEPKLKGSALGILSEVDLSQNRTTEAVAHAKASVEIARTSGVERILPDSVVALAAAQRAAGNAESAEAALREALELGQRQEDPKIGVSARLELARLRRQQGDLRAALAEAEAGIESIEVLRNLVPTLELQATLLAHYRSLFDLAIELRHELGLREPGADHSRAAFALAEQSQARTLLDSLPALAWRTDETSQRLRDLGSEVVAARRNASQQSEAADREDATRQLDLALNAHRTARTAWIRQHPHEQGRLERRPATVEQVQAALAPDQGVLQFHAGEDRTFLFVLGKERFLTVDLGATALIVQDVEVLIRRLVRPSVRGALQYREAAWRLYERTLLPADLDTLGVRRLLIVPDGPLVGIPFEALVTNATGNRFDDLNYLGLEYDISYLPSSAVGLQLQRHARRTASEGPELVAFADPSLGLETAQRSSGAGRALPQLPAAREEAQSLGRLLTPATIWLGSEARESTYRELSGHPPRYLHFATHALVDERRPELSAIVLTSSPDGDGRLEGWEIASQPMPVDQVVLSACGSALGRPVPGEGLVGLVQAFLDAGAKSVVASLWPVVDRGTQQLMLDFYSGLGTKSPVAALAEARRTQLDRGGLSAHPFYWAPFIAYGWPASEATTGPR